jgi:hypothetical protein
LRSSDAASDAGIDAENGMIAAIACRWSLCNIVHVENLSAGAELRTPAGIFHAGTGSMG